MQTNKQTIFIVLHVQTFVAHIVLVVQGFFYDGDRRLESVIVHPPPIHAKVVGRLFMRLASKREREREREGAN